MKKQVEQKILLALEGLLPDFCIIEIGLINKYQSRLSIKESSYTQNMSPARKLEFIAGRTMAKNLISKRKQLEIKEILRDCHGCPIWPNGIVGSISHKGRLCSVFLTDDKKYQSLGLDLEKTECLERGVWKTFSTSDEIEQAKSLSLEKGIFANMLFSAKEATFKCLFPIHKSKTPSISEILITITANKIDHYFFSFSFRGTNVQGLITITKLYTISFCFIIQA